MMASQQSVGDRNDDGDLPADGAHPPLRSGGGGKEAAQSGALDSALHPVHRRSLASGGRVAIGRGRRAAIVQQIRQGLTVKPALRFHIPIP